MSFVREKKDENQSKNRKVREAKSQMDMFTEIYCLSLFRPGSFLNENERFKD